MQEPLDGGGPPKTPSQRLRFPCRSNDAIVAIKWVAEMLRQMKIWTHWLVPVSREASFIVSAQWQRRAIDEGLGDSTDAITPAVSYAGSHCHGSEHSSPWSATEALERWSNQQSMEPQSRYLSSWLWLVRRCSKRIWQRGERGPPSRSHDRHRIQLPNGHSILKWFLIHQYAPRQRPAHCAFSKSIIKFILVDAIYFRSKFNAFSAQNDIEMLNKSNDLSQRHLLS